MDFLITKAYVEKAEDSDDGVLQVAVASSGVVDRYGEVIDPEGWDFKNFKKNPVFLWGHNAAEYKAPIGKVEKIWTEGKGKRAKLMFKPRFDMGDPEAKNIYRKYKEGFLNAFSVGFKPVEHEYDNDDVLHYTKSELLEISAVAVPANPQALVKHKSVEGYKLVDWKQVANEKEEKLETCEKEVKQNECGEKILEEVKALRGEVAELKVKPEPKKDNITEKKLQDILRILNQATSIALKQIKESK